MAQFGKEAEEQLLNHVRDVQSYIVDGDSPDDAIVKVARDARMHPDMLPLLVQAVNVGRQGYQREKFSGTGILNQVAEFPLARIENIKAALYPAKPQQPSGVLKASAVSADYGRPPKPVISYEKAAHAKLASAKLPASFFVQPEVGYKGDPKTKVARMQTAKEQVAREIDNAKVAEVTARDRFLVAMGRVADYFKQADYNRLSLAEVEWNAERLYGALATDVIDYVAARNRSKEARAAVAPRIARPVLPSDRPYADIRLAIDLGRKYADARRHVKDLEGAATEKIAQIMRPFSEHFPTPPMGLLGRPPQDFSGQNKAASLLTAIGAGIGSGVGGSMRQAMQPKATPDLISDMGMELDDPAHNDELNGIEAKAMLNDLLANDEVISGFDPQEVSEAYNEITQLAPSSATQPALMRPLLRKRLTAGAVEPFEAQQIADIEKTVRQTAQVGRQGGQHVSPVLV
jgi:hypothetical protein